MNRFLNLFSRSNNRAAIDQDGGSGPSDGELQAGARSAGSSRAASTGGLEPRGRPARGVPLPGRVARPVETRSTRSLREGQRRRTLADERRIAEAYFTAGAVVEVAQDPAHWTGFVYSHPDGWEFNNANAQQEIINLINHYRNRLLAGDTDDDPVTQAINRADNRATRIIFNLFEELSRGTLSTTSPVANEGRLRANRAFAGALLRIGDEHEWNRLVARHPQGWYVDNDNSRQEVVRHINNYLEILTRREAVSVMTDRNPDPDAMIAITYARDDSDQIILNLFDRLAVRARLEGARFPRHGPTTYLRYWNGEPLPEAAALGGGLRWYRNGSSADWIPAYTDHALAEGSVLERRPLETDEPSSTILSGVHEAITILTTYSPDHSELMSRVGLNRTNIIDHLHDFAEGFSRRSQPFMGEQTRSRVRNDGRVIDDNRVRDAINRGDNDPEKVIGNLLELVTETPPVLSFRATSSPQPTAPQPTAPQPTAPQPECTIM